MNDVTVTQGSEVSVNSKNDKFVLQICLYCNCKILSSAHACTSCRLQGRGPLTPGRVWGAWRLMASFGPSLDMVVVKSEIPVLGIVCLVYLGFLDLA